MKHTLLLPLLLLAKINQAQLSPVITSWIQNPDTTLAANRTTVTTTSGTTTIPSNVQKVQYSSSDVYISCTCIPGYSIGPWTGNPNHASNQNFVFKITLNPQQNTGVAAKVGLGHIGVWSNGVSIFNSSDAQNVNSVWERNAYYFEGKGFDGCLGHPQQQGEYHHHCNPTCLYNDKDSTHHSPIIGYMFDGFPVYGAYAYRDANGTGPIQRMRTSYRIRTDQTRTKQPDGTTATTAGPAVSTTYPMGSLLWDYEYVAGLGDLDDHNGRWCRTPEYPNGTYAYFVTIDSTRTPVYPYTGGLTYYGVVQAGNTGGGPGNPGGHNTISVSTTTYTGVNTGVTDLQQEIKVQIVPNPTQGYIYLYMDNNAPNNVIGTLYNEAGQVVHTIDYLQPSIAYSIDLNPYPAGIYLLHLSDGRQETVHRIVKAGN